MSLEFTKNICFFDIEGTGTDPAIDKIVSLSILKLVPSGLFAKEPERVWWDGYFNPEREMTQEVIGIHGITNEMVQDAPLFRELVSSYLQRAYKLRATLDPEKDKERLHWLQVHIDSARRLFDGHTFANNIKAFIFGCDLAGFNLRNYDIPILWEECYRTGVELNLDRVQIVDVGNIFKLKEPRSLSAAVKFYCGREHTEAHNAKGDVEATFDVLLGQMGRYDDLGVMGIAGLAEFSKMDKRVDLAGKIVLDADGDPCYALKSKEGVKVKDDPGFAEWMLGKDFTQNTKLVLRKLLTEIYGSEQTSEETEEEEEGLNFPR